MCSTFKFLAAAAVLRRIDQKQEHLDRRISYTPGDLLEWAPITREHSREGSMTLDALFAAAIEYSDNTAGNLLLRTIGGPAKLTDYVRSLGDSITRLDRVEPDLNSAFKGDERDTTSPAAMIGDIKTLLLEDRLSPESRERLTNWLVALQIRKALGISSDFLEDLNGPSRVALLHRNILGCELGRPFACHEGESQGIYANDYLEICATSAANCMVDEFTCATRRMAS
jgi:beta-lactamase class A